MRGGDVGPLNSFRFERRIDDMTCIKGKEEDEKFFERLPSSRHPVCFSGGSFRSSFHVDLRLNLDCSHRDFSTYFGEPCLLPEV